MKNWIGKFIIFIGVLHTFFGLAFILPQMGELLDEGIFNTINGQPKREAFLWFLFSGFLLLILGGLVNWMERHEYSLPKFLGWALFIVTACAVFLSPQSGGWLIFIPAIGLILKK